MSKRLFHLIAAGLLTVGLAGSAACSGGDGAKASPDRSKNRMNVDTTVVVEAVGVQSGPFEVDGDYGGEFFSERRARLSADAAGRLKSLSAHVGDRVEEGQVLAEVDALPYQQRVREMQAALRMAEAQVAEAQVQLENLEADLRRKRPLQDRELIPAREIEALEANVKSAEQKVAVAKATVEQSRARLLSAREDLANTKIRAPFDGRIAERHVEQGTYVNASQAVFEIVDDRALYLMVRVPEQNAGQVANGTAVTVRVGALGGKHFAGKIHRVAPALDPTTRTLRADVVLDDLAEDTALRPGMYARVSVNLGRAEQALTVPNQAVLKERDGTPFLWAVVDGKAEKRPVTLGLQGRNRSQILEGLSADDTVVLRGFEKLKPGTAVTGIRSDDAPQKPAGAPDEQEKK